MPVRGYSCFVQRRTFLVAAAGGVGLAEGRISASADPIGTTNPVESVQMTESTATPTRAPDEEVPVVDNRGNSNQTIVVDVQVTDSQGEPASGVTVELEDRGGTPDDRFGETGPGGRIRFLENVGPPPCNTQTVTLPDYGTETKLGCNDAGEEIHVTLTIGNESPTPAVADTPSKTSRTTVGSTPTDAQGPQLVNGGWLTGWAALSTWFLGITVLAPVVLGTLVAFAERSGSADDLTSDGTEKS